MLLVAMESACTGALIESLLAESIKMLDVCHVIYMWCLHISSNHLFYSWIHRVLLYSISIIHDKTTFDLKYGRFWIQWVQLQLSTLYFCCIKCPNIIIQRENTVQQTRLQKPWVDILIQYVREQINLHFTVAIIQQCTMVKPILTHCWFKIIWDDTASKMHLTQQVT